jgi:putative DNA primase/helicase
MESIMIALDNSDAVYEALQFLSPHCPHDEWLRIGMALKSELGEHGFTLYDNWSKNSSKYSSAATKATWRSIEPDGGVTIATLIYMAKKNGYRSEGIPLPLTSNQISPAIQQFTLEDETNRRRSAAIRAQALWAAAKATSTDHPYLLSKKIVPCDMLREIEVAKVVSILGYRPHSNNKPLQGRVLLAPVVVHTDKERFIATLEMIDESGLKAAIKDGIKSGGYWAAQKLPQENGSELVLLIGEGVATVLSAKAATGHVALAALTCYNLKAVGILMRELYPGADIVFLGEIGNGLKHAQEAAAAVSGKVAVPVFKNEDCGSDFNDVAQLYGQEMVKVLINAGRNAIENWPEPQSLGVHLQKEDYPIDALPPLIRAAIEEVAGYVQAPLPILASSAIAAISLATQAHVNAQRDDRLIGPTSLFLLTIAESGERKSTCDSYFSQAIIAYEAEQEEIFKPKIESYRADLDAWEMERAGIKDKIRQLAKDGKDTSRLKNDLRFLEHDKPQEPRVPRLVYVDATPEALAHKLATKWPTAGVMSAEGGTVLGAHGMSKESATRNLSQLNVLWDGGALTIDRRSSESFTVRNARLTIGLQVQQATLRGFLANTGDLARGSGFLARFLVSWPESTQGSRLFTSSPRDWPAHTAFNSRMGEILRKPVQIDESGRLMPDVMTFSPEAKKA